MNRGIDYYSLLQKKEKLLAQLNEVESIMKTNSHNSNSEYEFGELTNNKPPINNKPHDSATDDYAVLITDDDTDGNPPINNFFRGQNPIENLTRDGYFGEIENKKPNRDVLRTGKPEKSNGELHFSNKTYNLEFIKTPLLINGNVKKVLTLVKDISDNQKSDKPTELLKSIIESMDDFAVIKDLNQNIIAANNAFAKAAGKRKPNEVIGKSEFDLFGENTNTIKVFKEELIAQKLKKGESIESEGKFTSHDGSEIETMVKRFPIYNIDEEIVATASIARDITSLKNEHRQLVRSEEKYRMLIENLGEGACIIDGYDRFIFANSAAEKLFDVKRNGLIDHSLKQFIADKDFYTIKSDMKKEDGSTRSYEFEINSHKNTVKYVLLTISPFYNDSGYLVGSFILFRDISERRRIEEELLKSEISLKETVATKDKFFSIVAHDLKNPFGSIMGFSELILRKVKSNNIDKIGHYAQIILNASKHGFDLLENLLAWSRSQNGTLKYSPAKVSLNEIIAHNIEVVGESAQQKHISLIPPDSLDIEVFIDEDMINTVLRNILSNAIKYSNNHSDITITTSLADNNSAKISVSDQGVGIKSSNLDNLFRIDSNKSTRGTNGEEGTGLGLILSKEFVEKNKGKIWAESTPGRGSTFSFTVPLH